MIAKGKAMLIEDDMARDDHAPSCRVETSIAFVIDGVAEEDARCRAWGELVRGCGGEVGEAEAPENAHGCVVGVSTVQKKERCLVVARSARPSVE